MVPIIKSLNYRDSITGRIFNIQSPDCSGETDFFRIKLMFELLGIRIIGIQLFLKFKLYSKTHIKVSRRKSETVDRYPAILAEVVSREK